MKNKIIAIMLTAVLAFAVTACGQTKKAETASASASAAAETASASVSAATETASASASSTAETASEATKAPEETTQVSSVSEMPEVESVTPETETSETAKKDTENPTLSIPVVDEDLSATECAEIGDYKSLKVTDTYVAPTQKDVDTYIASLLSPVAVNDENATVGSGDTVNIDYEGKIDGKAFDGGTSKGYDLVIGSGTFIPGFEDGVIGMKAGETKDIDVTFPEKYHNADYAGKAAVFTVKVNAIKRAPELNDAWVTEFTHSDYKNVDDFKVYVKNLLEKNLRTQANSSMQYEAWQQVVNNSKVTKLPKSYVDRAAENFDKINQADAKSNNMTLEEFMKANNITDEYYQQMKNAYAMDSAKNTILCYAVWELEGLTTEDSEYTETLKEVSETLGKTQEELLKEYGEETMDNYGKTYAVLKRVLSYCTVVPANQKAATEKE